MTGRHERAPAASLTATGLRYRRAGRTILDGVSLVARPGRTLGVFGPSGTGKSSLLALLAGLEQPDEGTVQRVANARMGLILQNYGLVNLLTAAENVEMALQPALASGAVDRRAVRDRAAAALDQVGLTGVRDHLVEELSGGQQQRVAIARALVIEPDVLIADEFAAELDHDAKHDAVRLIVNVATRGGIVVLATHDPDILAHCDDLLRLADGHAHPTN
jgi:putative ABC transport system ATP-binding protein